MRAVSNWSRPDFTRTQPGPQSAISCPAAGKTLAGTPETEADGSASVLPVAWAEESGSAGRAGLTLEDAITTALVRNPNLIAARAAEPVAHAAYHVAETYPWNPQFQTQVLPYSRDRGGNDGAVSQQHVLVQTFETGGQRYYRRGAAAANWAQVDANIRQAELTTKTQTARLYFAALYARDQRDISKRLAELNEQLVGVIERRFRAGQARHADVRLAELQADSSRRQARLAEANYQTALAALRTHLNLPPSTELKLAGRLAQWRWSALGKLSDWLGPAGDDEGTLVDSSAIDSVLASRPDIVAARSAVAMASENLRLADAMRHPDLQIGPMWQRDEGSTEFWGIQAQIDIPVVNTGKPLVAQRIAELEQQQIIASQLERQARLQAQTAVQRFRRAWRLVRESEPQVVEDLATALQPFDDQFRAGQLTILELYAARAAMVQSQQGYLDLLNELASAAVDVWQATGLPVEQLFAPPPAAEEVPAP